MFLTFFQKHISPGGGREKGKKWTFLPTSYFIFGFSSFQPPEQDPCHPQSQNRVQFFLFNKI